MFYIYIFLHFTLTNNTHALHIIITIRDPVRARRRTSAGRRVCINSFFVLEIFFYFYYARVRTYVLYNSEQYRRVYSSARMEFWSHPCVKYAHAQCTATFRCGARGPFFFFLAFVYKSDDDDDDDVRKEPRAHCDINGFRHTDVVLRQWRKKERLWSEGIIITNQQT